MKKICPFCGSENLRRIENNKRLCLDCGAVFDPDKAIDKGK
jgi:transcription initiation factor TFIIIB Brf1 subunit/transcription initiation factor TFIIB